MHAVTNATAASWMIASRATLTPLFGPCHAARGLDRCFEFAAASCVLPRIACFRMPENPELLNDLKFENGSSSGSGDLSQKRRSDCKRNVSNHPEHNKLKISRGDHPQRSSHHVENQVMVKSPSYWIDRFQAKLDRRRTNENHKNSGTTVTRCHRIETSCTLAWRQNSYRSGQ